MFTGLKPGGKRPQSKASASGMTRQSLQGRIYGVFMQRPLSSTGGRGAYVSCRFRRAYPLTDFNRSVQGAKKTNRAGHDRNRGTQGN